MTRQSINQPRPRHVNPIPNAARVGNLVMSSVITGVGGPDLILPEALEDQVANVYANIRADVEAAGGSVDHIIKITFWLKDPINQRAALNVEWVRMFPDPERRPARHTLTLPAESKSQVQADFVAVLA